MKTSRNLAKKGSPNLQDLRCSKTQRGPVLLLTLMAEARNWRRKLASLDHLGFRVFLADGKQNRKVRPRLVLKAKRWEKLGFGSGGSVGRSMGS